MTPIELIQKELKNHINNLNETETDELGEVEEIYRYYRNELDWSGKNNPETRISDLIRDADLETPDFNIGFEQGYMRGLEVALSTLSNNITK